MMLLVDSSGSMERMPDQVDGNGNTVGVDRLPVCNGSTSERNRWSITLEALTGDFSNYACTTEDRSDYAQDQYDYGYFLPHFNFTRSGGVAAPQKDNGVLDSFLHRIKFGLMTFDGVGTTLGGDTLVDLPKWGTTSFLSEANGGPGMHSYGKVGSLSFPGCATTYGITPARVGPARIPAPWSP